jgi:hypothetical protein
MDDYLPERGFSIEMKTLEQVRTVSMLEVGCEGILSEGILGAFEKLGVLEEAIPMVRGAHGAMRICKKKRG